MRGPTVAPGNIDSSVPPEMCGDPAQFGSQSSSGPEDLVCLLTLAVRCRLLAIPRQHHRRVAGPVAAAAFDLHPAAGYDLAVGLGQGGAGEALGTGRVGVPDAAFAEGGVAATVGKEAAGGEVFMAGFLLAAGVG